MKWKVATALLSAALLLLLLFSFGVSALRNAFGINVYAPTAVVMQVKRLNQLATVKYSIQRVVGLREAKLPFGEESILLLVQGEAQAGIDLSKLSARDAVFTGPKTVQLALPRARLLNVYLNEKQTKVWDRQITWWTPWVAPDLDLEHNARMHALDDVRNAALEMGILDQAQTNADDSIRQLLAALQLTVTFKTRPLD